MRRANPILTLVREGVLTREDIHPGDDYTLAGTRASFLFATTRAYGPPASLMDLAEARSVFGFPASMDAVREARGAVLKRGRRRPTAPVVFRSSTV
ncbi:hypothetical protein [Terrabacter sp. BE26]|uniref:hypothetical protein n=1 Tax=Terrabacter sp. BE26 TaxID=2898152 RepID=UPI0035BE719C